MRRKYDMRICKCGRIHMIPIGKVYKACKENKNLLFFCGGCGAGTWIGADIVPDYYEPEKDCYSMYAQDFSLYESASITNSDFEGKEDKKGISEIYYSHGI